MKILLKSLLILALLGVTACVPLAGRHRQPLAAGGLRHELDERMRSTARPRILFVGNSYSFGVPKALEKVARDNGKSLKTGHSTFGGWTLSQHASFDGTLRKIRSGKWDVVVIQEHSLTPGKPAAERRKHMLPYVRRLSAEALQAGAIPILYQTWGRRDGDPARHGSSFYEMNGRVREGYRDAAADAGGLVIVPAGDYWETLFRDGKGRGLYQEDGSHPSPEGDEVTARAFFDTLYR